MVGETLGGEEVNDALEECAGDSGQMASNSSL